MKLLRTSALLALALAVAPAWAAKPFVAEYRARVMGGVSADARMSLTSNGGDRWTYALDIDSPVATLRQATVFEERNGAWRPLSGQDSSQFLMKKSQKNATYDWGKGEARWSGDVKADRMGPVRLQEGDLDAMLLNLALVRDVGAGQPLKYRMVDNGVVRAQAYQTLGKETVTIAGKQLNYRLVDNGVVRAQAYQNLGKETVNVGGQPRSATKVSRTSENKQVIVWVVEGLPVPARILQKKDGKDELDLVLKSVR